MKILHVTRDPPDETTLKALPAPPLHLTSDCHHCSVSQYHPDLDSCSGGLSIDPLLPHLTSSNTVSYTTGAQASYTINLITILPSLKPFIASQCF